MDLPVVCYAVFTGTDASIASASGCTVALTTASQKWTITPDADMVGAATFDPDGLFDVQVSNGGDIAAGATARVFLTNFTAGNLLEVMSIDPATGLAADYDGDVKVTVRRFPAP